MDDKLRMQSGIGIDDCEKDRLQFAPVDRVAVVDQLGRGDGVDSLAPVDDKKWTIGMLALPDEFRAARAVQQGKYVRLMRQYGLQAAFRPWSSDLERDQCAVGRPSSIDLGVDHNGNGLLNDQTGDQFARLDQEFNSRRKLGIRMAGAFPLRQAFEARGMHHPV